jgi:hypothetical protein
MLSTFPQTEPRPGHFEVAIDAQNLSITLDAIGRMLGYVQKPTPAHFEGMIRDVLNRLPQMCEIRAGYRICDIETHPERNDGLLVGGVFFSLQPIVTSQMRNSQKAALFACTIGSRMEAWRRDLEKDREEVMAHFVDTIASAAVENATDLLHDHIDRKMSEQGWGATNRYSPGYCGWSVAEQHLLFSLLPDRFCGITLTESALMTPMKSVSGVIGIGVGIKREGYRCGRCGRKDCLYRESIRGKLITNKK